MAEVQVLSRADPKPGISRLLVVRAIARMGRFAPGRVLFKYLALAIVLRWCQWCVGAPAIQIIEPLQEDFFAKSVSYQGIAIKAPKEVVDEALFAAYDRLDSLLSHQPIVTSNLVSAGAELHIIGREQVTSDLPEHRHLKGKKLEQYHGLTVDERTRGLGGLLTSCGEENLLKLDKDRYKGRDICVHEFAHNIRQHGIPRDLRKRFDEQYRKSLDKGLWEKSYAGSNPDEFFAELTMWYFGTHGDLHMTGTKPENGREGLKKYDPEAYELLDEFYSGRMLIPRMEPKQRESKSAN
jgi:toxin lethal factor